MSAPKIRDLLNDNSIVITIFSLILLGAAGYYLWRTLRPATASWEAPKFNYYVDDVDESTVVVEPVSEVPPIKQPDGHVLVLAVFFTCDSCNDKKLAYLERFKQQTQARIMSLTPDQRNSPENQLMAQDGLEVRLPGADQPWVNAMTPEGTRIRMSAQCPTPEDLKQCYPEKEGAK